MGDASHGLSFDPSVYARSPSPRLDKNASPTWRRVGDIHIPSPDHSVSIFSSEHFEKSGLVAAQEAALHDAAILEMGWTGGESEEYAFMPEGEKPRSPAIGSLQDLKSLRPIRLRNMKIGKVHRGRILSGTLCCKSVKIFAVMNVLEEEGTGDATKFVISNAVPRSATTATAQRLYPEGAQLSIREPYLKRFADGMVGILVENPNDIIFNYLPDEIPSPVSERENLLWPVYKDPSGDGPDTPVFNTYGSFLSSPSLLSGNSLNSPRTPTSPRSFLSSPSRLNGNSLNSPLTPSSPRSFLHDSLDGLTIRTIRKFKGLPKQEQGLRDHEVDPEDLPVKLSSGDDGVCSAAENASERNSSQGHGEAPGDLSAENLEDGGKWKGSVQLTTDEGLETRVGPIGDSNRPFSAGKEEHEQPSSPTGGLISESSRFVANLTGVSEVENHFTDPREVLEFEKGTISCKDNQAESLLGVDFEGGPPGLGAILIGVKDVEEIRSRAVNVPDTLSEEGGGCKLPTVELATACGETAGDTSNEPSNCSQSATRDGLEDSDLASLDSVVQVRLARSPEPSDVCADSGSQIQCSERNKESDEGCVGTSRPAGADGVSKEGGVEMAAPELRCSFDEGLSLPGGEGITDVDSCDGGITSSSSIRSFSSPRANGHDKSDLGLQVGAQLEEACNGSSGKGRRLSIEVQSDGGLDAASHQTEVHNLPLDCDSEKGVGTPPPSTDAIYQSLSNGGSSPAGGKNVKSVDPKASKSTASGAEVVDEELSAAALRMKGNQRFSRQDWIGAVELYTRAIHKTVQESKEQMAYSKSKRAHHVNSNGVETEMEVVMDYSNRAEAWLRLHHYERALADAERALSVDPNHLKSLFRKGRALLGLGDYQQALTHLESAYARAPFDRDLLAAIKLSRIGDHQSRLGVYELTDYYLRGRFAGETPTCADYVGPVQVKAASGDKGRGLFLRKHVEAGDLLLVSNPLAMFDSMSANKNRRNSLDADAKERLDPEVQEKLVQSIRERAKVSTKNRQRLFALCYGEDSGEQPIPSMDLFIPSRRVAAAENLNLDEERITRLVLRNAIDRNMVSTSLERRHDPPRGSAEDLEERFFWGLWVLPSFINHSCIPNVSLVVIGRALFVYASRDLSAGEELLCSYFNVFQPLPQRQEISSRCWGFTCKCARCFLETRFESSLTTLYSLHSQLQPSPKFVLQLTPDACEAPAKDLAKELEVIDITTELDHRERCWLQASFTQLYTCIRDSMVPHGNYPYLEVALSAMQVVCPGSNSTLELGLLARESALKESNGKKTSQYKGVNQQLLRICQRIYGKHKTAILQSLIDGSRSEWTSKS